MIVKAPPSGDEEPPEHPKRRDTSELFAHLGIGNQLAPIQAQLNRIAQLSSLQSQVDQLTRGVVAPFQATIDRALRTQVGALDSWTPAILRAQELSATARLAETWSRSSAFASWRSSLAMDDQIARLVTQIAWPTSDTKLLKHVVESSRVSVELTRWASSIAPTTAILRGISAPSIRAHEVFVWSLPKEPTWLQVRTSLVAGTGINGLIGTEMLTADLDETDEAEAIERVHGTVIDPWDQAPVIARAELLVVLGGLDSTVPDLLKGGWDDASRRGPAAVAKIANCGVEALDRSLRAAAPNDAVLGWLAGHPQRDALLDEKGRPTRSARVRYLLRDRKGDAKLVEAQVASMVAASNELCARLQATKHKSAATITGARSYLVAVEAVLHQLFLGSEQ